MLTRCTILLQFTRKDRLLLPVEAFGPVDTMSIMQEPDPVSPVGFATLAGLVGIIAGVILAPWLDRWHRSDARGKK
jgi:hypothetical protein